MPRERYLPLAFFLIPFLALFSKLLLIDGILQSPTPSASHQNADRMPGDEYARVEGNGRRE
jgi:hypothetical protein